MPAWPHASPSTIPSPPPAQAADTAAAHGQAPLTTHRVFNQAEPLCDSNLFASNRALQAALALHAPTLDTRALHALGAQAGSAALQAHARLANAHPPVLHTHDRLGRRTDQVEFHPSYHALMDAAAQAGLHGTPWAQQFAPTPSSPAACTPPSSATLATPAPAALPGTPTGAVPAHAHVQRAAGFMLLTEAEPSILCPISMTYAALPALRGNPAIFADWAPGLMARAYDPAFASYTHKRGLTMGMGMTEKQGGSDVRANTTQALPDGHDAWGARVRLLGHKWFFSAPMCDAFLVLAHSAAGLSCYFVPRILPTWLQPDRAQAGGAEGTAEGGEVNALRIQRLKHKLGNHANASSEVEFHHAYGWLVGEEGRGVAQILEMGTLTRLDCVLGTSGLMRQALSLALHHTAQRSAFGKPLIAQPLMRNVLADLAIESEAACALSMRLAHAFDHADDAHERLLARLLTPVAKFWICKRGAAFAQEAMECLGGNGYVEEGGAGVMARIYREMPLNSIWEGAGNIMALDVLRALRKGDAAAALARELRPALGAHPALDRLAAALPVRVEQMATEIEARRLAQDVALAMQAALLVQSAPAAVWAAFCDSRLGADWGWTFGSLGAGVDFDAIIARALPH